MKGLLKKRKKKKKMLVKTLGHYVFKWLFISLCLFKILMGVI